MSRRGLAALTLIPMDKIIIALFLVAATATAEAATVTVQADKILFRLSELMIGANMEDLHYQMVGGFDSQLIHGESFFEPSPTQLAAETGRVDGFANCGGKVSVETNGELVLGKATRLTSLAATAKSEASLELNAAADGAGLAICVSPDNADNRWEWYSGYTAEVVSNCVVLARAERANKPREVARAPLAASGWIALALGLQAGIITVHVNGKELIRFADASPLPPGLWAIVARNETRFRAASPFRPNPLLAAPGDAISLRWKKVQTGSARGRFAVETNGAWFANSPSQGIAFTGGDGEWGIDNAGLKRWGIHLVAGKPYEGFIRAKTVAATEVWVSLRSAGGEILAVERLPTAGRNEFEKLPFALTPSAHDEHGRFAVTLKKPGEVTLGYVFLQPGEWGRFKRLPVRKDLAEALLAQGIRVLRFNGGMIEVPGYRWRNLRGPRDLRPPYDGFYDRYCSSGFGPAEAVAFGKAAGLPVVPALNIAETPEEVADFVATCQPQFYQVANETRFDEDYVRKFKQVAEAVWAVAPDITLVTTSTRVAVRDDESDDVARKKLALPLELAGFARARGKHILFDSHSFGGAATVAGIAAFARCLQRLAPDPKLVSVGILEFNAGAFDFQRGRNHALEMNAAYRNGDVIRAIGMPNVSQPWGVYQTDWKAVLWTQGNIYYTPGKVWVQPAYYVDQMIAGSWGPDAVACTVDSPEKNLLDVFAAKTADGRRLVLRMVNPSSKLVAAKVKLSGMSTKGKTMRAEILAGDPAGFNTLAAPEKYKPKTERRPLAFRDGQYSCSIPPCSFMVLTME